MASNVSDLIPDDKIKAWREKEEARRAAMTQEERDAEDKRRERRLAGYSIESRFDRFNNKWRDEGGQRYQQRGHDIIMQVTTHSLEDLSDEDFEALASLQEGEKLDSWIEIKNGSYAFASYSMHGECRKCKKVITLETNGVEVRAHGGSCEYYSGFPPYVFTLDIPSGKMVVGNDFRDIFPVKGEGDCFNFHKDMLALVQAYAEEGMAHAFVGNTCPGVYRITPELYTIGGSYYTDADEDGKDREHSLGECVAGVCTDLWWYSICDYDEYVKRAGAEPSNFEEVVEVIPGTYEFTHQFHCIDRDKPGLVPYAWVRLIKRAPVEIPQPE